MSKATPPTTPEHTATRLLDAHVTWQVERLTGDGLADWLGQDLDAALADAAKLKLADVIKLADVQAVVRKYVADLQLGGAVPALIGQIVRDLYAHRVHAETRLDALIPDRHFEEWLDKLLELKDLREALVHASVTNPIYGALISELLYASLVRYSTQSTEMAGRVPGAKAAFKLGKSALAKASPQLGASIETSLKAFVTKQTSSNLARSEQFLMDALASDEFRQAVLDMWDGNKQRTVADLQSYVGTTDQEELFVIGYEHWQTLRQSPWLLGLIDAAVAGFFDHYAKWSLADLLAEIGITRDMMYDDALRFAPVAIKGLKRRKLLEPLVRRQLAPFYESAAAQAVLAETAAGS